MKPITVAREEARQAITQAINEHGQGLPAFVLVDILQNLLLELRQIESQQLSGDMQRYQESLEEEQAE